MTGQSMCFAKCCCEAKLCLNRASELHRLRFKCNAHALAICAKTLGRS